MIAHFSALAKREAPALDPLALDMLLAYRWPGNVRELENVIERAIVLAEDVIRPEHLGISVSINFEAFEEATRTLSEVAAAAAKDAEVEAITRALAATAGNKSRAAELLGVSYKTLLTKVKEYGLGRDAGSDEKDARPQREL